MNFGNKITVRESVVLNGKSGDIVSPTNGEIWYNTTLGKFRKYQDGVISDLDTTGSSTGVSALKYIDQTPDNATYGLLTGTVNGTNKVFTVSQTEYLTGKLEVYLNGIIQAQGATDDWIELNPAVGTFEFVTAPPTNSIITAIYITEEPAPSAPTEDPVFTGSLTINSTTGGLLIPRMTTTQRNAIVSPDAGLQIYNTTEGYIERYDSFWGWLDLEGFKNTLGDINYFQDFGTPHTGLNDGILQATFGTGSTSSMLSESGSYGILRINSGSNSTSTRAGFIGATVNGTGEFHPTDCKMEMTARVRFPVLSNSTDGYRFHFGFLNTYNSANTDRSMVFLYDQRASLSGFAGSDNWTFYTASAGANRSFEVSTIAVVANTWYKLKATFDSALGEVKYYIDGTLLHTQTTNIPTADMVFGATSSKVTTTPALDYLDIDYISLKIKYNNIR